MSDETFENAVRLLNSLPSNAVARQRALSADKSWCRGTLALFSNTMTHLGYPAARLNHLNIIHIAGSKGKGSTAALTASILSQFLSDGRAPTKIGIFASPHVRTIRERIQIIEGEVTETSDWKVSESQFATYFFQVWKKVQELLQSGILEELPYFFRCLLAVAIHAFVCEGVDTVILECGIGGEFDATNFIDRPIVSAITMLELEHVEILGNDLTSIAWHKSGIMRAGAPAFTIPQRHEALAELQRRAAEKGTRLLVVDPPASPEHMDKSGCLGVNAALARQLALYTLAKLRGGSWVTNGDIERKVQRGIFQQPLPGRFETRQIGTSAWYIDGAHTLQSLEKAAKWFSACIKGKRSDARILLFNQEARDTKPMLSVLHRELCQRHGHHGDKAGPGFTHVLMASNAPFHANTFGPEARSMTQKCATNGKRKDYQQENAMIWASLCDDANQSVLTYPTVREAVEYVREELLMKDYEVQCFATGSMHLVGGLEAVLDELAKDPSVRINIPEGEAS
ncbi:hypothetical protein HIM_04040 [Hirsutella minnesotensis 3608]|uniref:tetrahydrofolate synthase n=1 Tax=Hirsutella minnesotensis 3608 TaxID=1043627 RepID=A0A0F8A698_9HYPO|nr:hypothetical protein HIM_04040 [Hirsutella minnesotensis 3608]